MPHPITIGQATLYQGDCLQVLPTLTDPIDALITDPPYSGGGMVRGDRTNQSTAAKYVQSGTALDAEHNIDFFGDNRDARSWGCWMTLWLFAVQPMLKPGAYVLRHVLHRLAPVAHAHRRAAGRRLRLARRGALGQDRGAAALRTPATSAISANTSCGAATAPCRPAATAAPGPDG